MALVRLQINMTPQKHAELKEMSEKLGVSMSGITVQILGEFIERKKLEQKLIEQSLIQMNEVIKRGIAESESGIAESESGNA